MASRRNGHGATPSPPPPPEGISLLNFFVFNATLCKREGEEEKKILYYYPPEENIDKKVKNVGLCEAVAQFTETFAPTTPVESIHSQKKRMLLHQPEKDYWMHEPSERDEAETSAPQNTRFRHWFLFYGNIRILDEPDSVSIPPRDSSSPECHGRRVALRLRERRPRQRGAAPHAGWRRQLAL